MTTVTLSVAGLLVPAALLAVMDALKVPVCVGVPEITPVAAAKDTPVGSPLTE